MIDFYLNKFTDNTENNEIGDEKPDDNADNVTETTENTENSDESEEQTSQTTVIAQPTVAVNVEEIESTAEEISEAITMEAIQEANQYNQDSHQNGFDRHQNEDSDEDVK